MNRKLYAGTRWHGHGTPGGDYQATVDAWFDHYLLGVANGIEKMAYVHSEMSTYDGAVGWYAGPWPRTTNVTLFAQHASGAEYPWRLLPTSPKATATSPQATLLSRARTPRRTPTRIRAQTTAGCGSRRRASPRTRASSAR